MGGLFAEEFAERALGKHRASCVYFNPAWHGPASGVRFQMHTICATRADNGTPIYCYLERCRLVHRREDGRWLAVIEMGTVHGRPWFKDGTEIVVGELDMWPMPALEPEHAHDEASISASESA